MTDKWPYVVKWTNEGPPGVRTEVVRASSLPMALDAFYYNRAKDMSGKYSVISIERSTKSGTEDVKLRITRDTHGNIVEVRIAP